MFGCKKDNDQDPIVGRWRHTQDQINDKPPETIKCGTIVTFNADGTYISQNYKVPSCEKTDANKGTWKNNGNNAYTLMGDGETRTYKITYEKDSFYFAESETNPNTGKTTVYKDIYTRL